MRVFVAGFQHETNTFLDAETSYQAFVKPDAWPGLLVGSALFNDTAGMNLPITGFLDYAKEQSWNIVPGLWCSATPSGPIQYAAFQRIKRDILAKLAASAPSWPFVVF